MRLGDLDRFAEIHQDVELSIGNYGLSALVAAGVFLDSSIRIQVLDRTSPTATVIGSDDLFAFSSDGPGFWKHEFQFTTVNSGTHRILLSGLTGIPIVDNVVAVPEPATTGLLFLGVVFASTRRQPKRRR